MQATTKDYFFWKCFVQSKRQNHSDTLDTEFHSPDKTLNAYVRNSEKLTLHSMKDLEVAYKRAFTSNDIGLEKNQLCNDG